MNIFLSSATLINPQITQSIHDSLLSLIQLALLGLVTSATWGIKLWINSLNSKWKKAIAERLVKFAEQQIEPNPDKVAYVSAKLHEHFPRLSEEEIQHLLEEAVANFKAQSAVVNVVTVNDQTPKTQEKTI